VRTAIAQANVNQAKGSFDGPQRRPTRSTPTTSCSRATTTVVVVAYRNGAPVRLSDVADVVDGAEKQQAGGVDERRPGGHRQHPAPARRQHHRGRRPHQGAAAAAQGSLPAAVEVSVLTDRTTPSAPRSRRAVRADADRRAGRDGDFLFLRNAAATIIPSVAVPLSLVGTFGVMYLLGYSLNNLTLMALTISTGFVVDDAIVMIENIARYIEEGENAAARRAQGAPSRSASRSSR
jgi:multidrug efflux pump